MEFFRTNGSLKIEDNDFKQEFLGNADFEPLVYRAGKEGWYVEFPTSLDQGKAEISGIISGHRVDYLIIKKIERNENSKN